MSMLAVLDQFLNLLSSDIVSSVGAALSTGSSAVSFGVEAAKCTPQSCPGSFYTAIATAWANIGYVTHADVLRFLDTTNFGKWAILLYIGAAITGLFGVATNAPMKNYTWFFIGPALYSFLVGTTMEVQGVNWVVANVAQENMAEVWKNAETGLANTKLARESKITINGKDGPSGQYEVAMPMVFLDELFSATANILVEWTGIGSQVAGGGQGTRTNLANNQSQAEGPWWLLSTLKWGYVENITSATARNPDVRDALVTFLGSECGEKFKEGIDSGAYIAAAQARGATPVTSVIMDGGNYQKFIDNLSNVAIPAPRSLARLFKEGKSLTKNTVINNDPNFFGPPNLNPGSSESDLFLTNPNNPNFIAPSFLNFSERLTVAMDAGRGHGIVCSEYLWTIIQALRYEAGHSYYQLTRSSPTGLNEEQFINTLLYGWDVRKKPDSNIATADEQEAFIKHLILAYIVRNELLFAPQITSVDQRFAPSEQAKSYSDAYVRSYGSKAKFIELYNAAIMMPYLQGILAYFLLVSYPIACMLVILPGHYKGFFTWVSFFAWIKIWDVGFAMVQVIERSVWAMVGNNGHMAATANVLIETAEKVGGIGVTNPVGTGMGNGGGVLNPANLAAQGAVPLVCSIAGMNGECADNKAGVDQTLAKAVELFDKLLLTSANIDLDLSNGWYIYIMSALYLAVPAVTGQLVLGAKAGSASMMKDAWSGVANDGSNAAKTGAQHKDVNALTSNANSLGQAASAKAMRQSGFAAQALGLKQQQLQHGLAAANLDNEARAHNSLASQLGNTANDFDMSRRLGGEMLPHMGSYALPGQGIGKALGDTRLGKAFGQKVDNLASKVPGYGKLKSVAGAISNPYAASVGSSAGGGAAGGGGDSAMLGDYKYGGGAAAIGLKQTAGIAGSRAAGFAQNAQWEQTRLSQAATGMGNYAGTLSEANNYDAQSAAWEARNDFAAHAAATAGIAGMNAGSLAGGPKPVDATGFAMEGALGGRAQSAAQYAGNGFLSEVQSTTDKGKAELGWGYVDQYRPTGILDVHGASIPARANGDYLVSGAKDGVSNAGRSAAEAISDLPGTVMSGANTMVNGNSVAQVDTVMKIKALDSKQ